VHHYAKQNSVAFIITTPTGMKLEQKIRDGKDEERVVFSSWPSWKRFFKESIIALVRYRQRKHRTRSAPDHGLGRVLIVNMITSEKFSGRH
jgi:hypothetical protein